MDNVPPNASERIVQAVAEKRGTDPLALPPLYDTVDPDALDAFVRASDDCSVTFRYAGCTVTIEDSSAIIVDGQPVTSVDADPAGVGAAE